jgi:hypothetical protein
MMRLCNTANISAVMLKEELLNYLYRMYLDSVLPFTENSRIQNNLEHAQ